LTGLALDNLILHFADALPKDNIYYDYAIFCWDMWWMRHALVELRTDPLTTDYVVYPFTHSLALHVLTPFWSLLSIPLQSFMDLNVILNAFIVISFLLTAYFTSLFAHRHGSSWPLSILAGTLMAFTPAMIRRAMLGHINILPMWWIPLSLLAFDLACDSQHPRRDRGHPCPPASNLQPPTSSPRRKILRLYTNNFQPPTSNVQLFSALPLAFCLYAALLTDFQYMMWVPVVLGPYAVFRFLSPEFRSDRGRQYRLLARLALAVLVFACLLLVYPARQLLQLDTSGYPQASLETAHAYSLPALAPVRPGTGEFTLGLLLVPLAIAVWVLDKDRKRGMGWLAMAAIALLLALGPYLSLEPYTDFRLPLPYLALHKLLRGQYRTPVRFAIPGVFSLSVFVATKGQAVFERLRVARPVRLALVGGLLVLIVLDYGLLRPFPIFFPKEYAVYEEVAEDPRDVVLVDVPLGIFSYAQFGHGEKLIYYQAIHKKRIPSGALSRLSLTIYDYLHSFNVLEAMAGIQDLTPAATDELTHLIEEWGIGYVFVHRDMYYRERLKQLPPFLTEHPSLCFWREEGDLLAYRARPPEGCPPLEGTGQVSLGASGDVAHVGTGWYPPENIGGVTGRWAGGIPTATLRLDLHPQTYCLSFNAWAYPPDQSVTVEVNEETIAVHPMPEAWTVYTATIPASTIRPGEATHIRFSHAALLAPSQRTSGESTDERPLGAAYDWVVVEPCAD